MEQITGALREARLVLSRASEFRSVVSAAADGELLTAIGAASALVREAQVLQSQLATEVAYRSRPELGHSGLAAREGAVNAVALIAAVTRCGTSEAAQQIRIGDLLSASSDRGSIERGATPGSVSEHAPGDKADGAPEAASDSSGPPAPLTPLALLAPLADAIRDGRLGAEGADRITRTLAPVANQVDAGLLAQAVTVLSAEAASRNADELVTMARGVRDTLDRAGVSDREQFLRSQRGLRRGRVIDGLRRVTMVLDPETDVIILGAIDHAMSPRLGGPRFTDAADVERAQQLAGDGRSNEQIALDILAQLVRSGVERDDGTILGSTKPGVRVTIPLADLLAGLSEHGAELLGAEPVRADHHARGAVRTAGPAWLEGHPEPVSAATARRILCEAGALPIVLGGEGLPIDVGRTRRLFTAAQRVALAMRDGGCRFPDCDRPPAWTEAHHIDPWRSKRPGLPNGPTDLDNGVLLCRRHHMIVHDHGWAIRHGSSPGEFVLRPPAGVDPLQTPRLMPSKAPPWLRTG